MESFAVLSWPEPQGLRFVVGIRVDAVIDLSKVALLREEPEHRRIERALEAQASYLHSLGDEEDAAFSLRLLSDGSGTIECYVLGAATVSSQHAVSRRAESLVSRLLGVPDHVKATQITELEELTRAVRSLAPADSGLVQIGKQTRVDHGRSRPTVGTVNLRYLSILPFARTRASWTMALESLRRQREATLIAFTLSPRRMSQQLALLIATEARFYGSRRERTQSIGIFGSEETHAGDSAAELPSRLYEDLLARYQQETYAFSVTLASEGRLDAGLVESVASAITPLSRRDSPDTLPRDGLVTGHSVVALTDPAQRSRVQIGLDEVRPIQCDDPALQQQLEVDLAEGRDRRTGLRELRCLVDPGEALSLFRLPIASGGHLPGMFVMDPPDVVRRASLSQEDAILMGHQGSSGAVEARVSIPLRDLCRHAFIVGTPGSGKTNTALNICLQLAEKRIPFAVIEPVNSELNDYRWLATRPEFEDLLLFTVGDDSVSPLRLNPFEIPAGQTAHRHISNLLACFEAAFGLWDPLPFIYRRALNLAYQRAGIRPDIPVPPNSPSPTLWLFIDAMEEVVGGLRYEGEYGSNIAAASVHRASALAEGTCATVLSYDRSFPMAELMERPVVYELAHVGDNPKEQALVTLLLINAMRGYYRSPIYHRADRVHAILLEEAHRIFRRAAASSGTGERRDGNAQALASERVAQSLAEDRKYGQSYILIDQQVGKVSEDAYKITNLKIMHRTSDEQDRKLLGATMGVSPEQMAAGGTLRPFQALVSHNRFDQPMTLSVPDVRRSDAEKLNLEAAPLALDDELRARAHAFASNVQSSSELSLPYPECGRCASHCLFGARVRAMGGQGQWSRELINASAAVNSVEHIKVVVTEIRSVDGLDILSCRDGIFCTWLHAYRMRFECDRVSEAEKALFEGRLEKVVAALDGMNWEDS